MSRFFQAGGRVEKKKTIHSTAVGGRGDLFGKQFFNLEKCQHKTEKEDTEERGERDKGVQLCSPAAFVCFFPCLLLVRCASRRAKDDDDDYTIS